MGQLRAWESLLLQPYNQAGRLRFCLGPNRKLPIKPPRPTPIEASETIPPPLDGIDRAKQKGSLLCPTWQNSSDILIPPSTVVLLGLSRTRMVILCLMEAGLPSLLCRIAQLQWTQEMMLSNKPIPKVTSYVTPFLESNILQTMKPQKWRRSTRGQGLGRGGLERAIARTINS